MSNPITGAMCLMTGARLLNQPSIRPYVLMPLAINIILFTLLFWFGANQFGHLDEWISSKIPEWLQWISWLLWLLFFISAVLIGFFTFTLFANIVAAPFNSLLASAVERHITGKNIAAEENSRSFVARFIPTIINEIKKVLYFLLWSIPFLILFMIPVINIIAPVMWFLFTAWILSLEYVDYPLDNRGLNFVTIRKQLKTVRLSALGFGTMINLATMIPVINFLVMPASVAGATAFVLTQMKTNETD